MQSHLSYTAHTTTSYTYRSYSCYFIRSHQKDDAKIGRTYIRMIGAIRLHLS